MCQQGSTELLSCFYRHRRRNACYSIRVLLLLIKQRLGHLTNQTVPSAQNDLDNIKPLCISYLSLITNSASSWLPFKYVLLYCFFSSHLNSNVFKCLTSGSQPLLTGFQHETADIQSTFKALYYLLDLYTWLYWNAWPWLFYWLMLTSLCCKGLDALEDIRSTGSKAFPDFT